MHLEELVDPKDLTDAMSAKMVRKTTSPEGDKHLYVYTELAQYKRHWTPATINCRGLVVDDNGQIIARPFPKFFNYGEHPEGSLRLDGTVDAYDKLDGSLAVLATDETFTSKGSFVSHVAEQARKVYEDKYLGEWDRNPALTYCFECIWPEGRIVLDYGDMEDLILLGAVDTKSGDVMLPHQIAEWSGPKARHFGTMALREALAIPHRKNAEGLVLYVHDSEAQVKIKQDDYLALHRIVTGTSAITVWERLAVWSLKGRSDLEERQITQLLGISPDRVSAAMADGEDWEASIAERVPDEFHAWLRDTASELSGQHLNLMLEVAAGVESAEQMEFPDRKSAVMWIKEQDWPVTWNTILDGYLNDGELPPRAVAALWKQIRPTGATWGMKGEL